MAVERAGQIPPEHLDLLAEQGFYGLALPAEVGGLGVDFDTACQVIEIFASGCLSTAFVWLQHHGAVRAVASSDNAELRERWLPDLGAGRRRAGLALAGAIPGPPMLAAERVAGGYLFNGSSPWVTGWGLIDVLHAAARDEHDNVVWGLIDTTANPALSAEPLELIAVMASETVRVNFRNCWVSADRVTRAMPLSRWQQVDGATLRSNGSLALGVAARCCALIGPSSLDDELTSARAALEAGTPQTMPAARAVAAALALRAAAALVVATGSRAVLADAQAQRLAREAMFLLVFATRPAIKERLAALLANPTANVELG